jgi:hypothetical protein
MAESQEARRRLTEKQPSGMTLLEEMRDFAVTSIPEHFGPVFGTDVIRLIDDYARLLTEQDELRELARSARNTAAAPDYDEEAIRDTLWALVDAVLVPLVEAATDEGER